MELTCPHCHKPIDVLEPKDLDTIGLTQNIRAPYIKSGDLPPWAVLRSGKFFLFLREDVDALWEQRQREGLTRFVKRSGIQVPENVDEEKLLKNLEKAFKDSGITLPGEGADNKRGRAAKRT